MDGNAQWLTALASLAKLKKKKKKPLSRLFSENLID